MRLTCGSHVVGCVWWHLQLLFAARGLPKTSSEPRRGRGIVFRNSRISLSAGRRACEPAAKPAIPGVILLHNGFVWPERTLVRLAEWVPPVGGALSGHTSTPVIPAYVRPRCPQLHHLPMVVVGCCRCISGLCSKYQNIPVCPTCFSSTTRC